jgi:hypothetical protein
VRGLPPLPNDVLELRLAMDHGGTEFGFVQHFYSQASSTWNVVTFHDWISAWATFAEQSLLNCMPSSTSFTTCRLARYGITPLQVETVLPTNQGAGTACAPLNTALCLTWRCSAPGFSARSHTRLPLIAEAVSGDGRSLVSDFWGLFQLQADDYLFQVNAIQVTVDPPSELIVVSRSSGGFPRPASQYSPVVSGVPSRLVGTLQDRIR